MMLCEFAVTFLSFLMTCSATVAHATNNTSVVEGAGTKRETVVCNQYIGQDGATANEAIKKLDEKLDKLIKLLQPPTPNPGKMSFSF